VNITIYPAREKAVYMKNIKIFLVPLILIFIFFAGCNTNDNGTDETTSQTESAETTADHSTDNDALKGLLPERSGFVWKYLGFAEYGHLMTLDAIIDEGVRTTYSISGTVDDMSDGESGKDQNLSVRYEIADGELMQYAAAEMMMDSGYEQIVLIKAPLEKGTTWTQTAVTKDGIEEVLKCEITDVKDDGDKIYTVRYDQEESGYYEIRQIREKTGIISFTKLFISDSDRFEIGFSLYEDMTGYPEEISLKSVLPPFDTDLRYFGLAEYGHFVKWTDTVTAPDKVTYEMNGYFNDGSGIPGSFKVNYILDRDNFTVTESVVENTREGVRRINSVIPDMIILKAPLDPGNAWHQDVMIDGTQYTMDAVITSVKVDTVDLRSLIYTVRYTVSGVPDYFNNEYIQERLFKTGRGMISFAQLMTGDIGISGKDLEDSYLVSQAILNHMFGYSQDQSH
jgi:hypothetical protein